MRLIDADARIEVQFYDEEFEEWSLKTCTVEEYLNHASEMPQIIDAVPVVRCKDCKWRDEPGCAIRIVDESDRPEDDDYCSFGERKTAESE